MGKYICSFSNFTTSTSNKTAAKLIGRTGTVYEVVEVFMYGAGTATAVDVQHQVNAGFLTNGGLGSAGVSNIIPERFNQQGQSALMSAATGFTVEPTTYNTSVFQLFSFNQRGGMRWAVPRGEGFMTGDGATALSFGVRVQSASAGNVDGGVHYWEG